MPVPPTPPTPGTAPKVSRMEKSDHGQSKERDLPKLTVDSGLREQEPKRKESWIRRGKLFLWAVNQHGKIGGGEGGGDRPCTLQPLAAGRGVSVGRGRSQDGSAPRGELPESVAWLQPPWWVLLLFFAWPPGMAMEEQQ